MSWSLRDAAGLAFVDGGLAANSAALLSLAQRELGTKQVHTLVNTHWHREHTGLNERLGKQGVKIIAHENTRLWLSTTVRYEPDGPPFLPLPAAARPNATTYTSGELKLGDETLATVTCRRPTPMATCTCISPRPMCWSPVAWWRAMAGPPRTGSPAAGSMAPSPATRP